jgi:hypothetical protein
MWAIDDEQMAYSLKKYTQKCFGSLAALCYWHCFPVNNVLNFVEIVA